MDDNFDDDDGVIEESPSSTKVRVLLAVRERSYQNMSREIIAFFGATLSEVAHRLFGFQAKNIEWDSIEQYGSANGFYSIRGVAFPEVGSMIDVEGEKIIITGENSRKYSHGLVMLLPLRLLEEPDVDEIATYAKSTMNLLKKFTASEVIEILQEFDEKMIKELTNNVNVGEPQPIKTPEKRTAYDFDVSDLSSEQFDKIKLSGELFSKSVN